MWPFTKKKVYKVEWSYESCHSDLYKYTEIIKAKDIYEAWEKAQAKHSLPIYMVTIKEIDINEKIL